jgi:hypothetical protein
MMYPLVRELAGDGIPVTVTCRVLKIARPRLTPTPSPRTMTHGSSTRASTELMPITSPAFTCAGEGQWRPGSTPSWLASCVCGGVLNARLTPGLMALVIGRRVARSDNFAVSRGRLRAVVGGGR